MSSADSRIPDARSAAVEVRPVMEESGEDP